MYMSNELLISEFKKHKAAVKQRIASAMADGQIIIGGDGISDRKRKGIVSVLFTPDPVYVETRVWPEKRHTADNICKFFRRYMDKMGARNVVASVSDTVSTMRAVWDLLPGTYPWLLIIPCAAHCFNLLFKYLIKHRALTPAANFCNSQSQFWRSKAMPRAILERIQVQEYGHTLHLQRAGFTRWTSTQLVAEALLRMQTAIQKTVVDDVIKNEVLKDKYMQARKAAADVADMATSDSQWEALQVLADLLRPIATALDKGPANNSGMGSVFASFFHLDKHFATFKFPLNLLGTQLKAYCCAKLHQRRSYLLRHSHELACLLDPRVQDAADQPTQVELQSAMELMEKLASSEYNRKALVAAGITSLDQLPATYDTAVRDEVGGDYAKWRAKSGGSLQLPFVWEKSSVADALTWWKTWGSHIHSMQTVAVKLMSMPKSFAAGERAFSNAGYIQSVWRTKLSYARLHLLLYIYFKYRLLPGMDVDAAAAALRSGGEDEQVSSDDEEGSVGSDGSLSDVQAMK